MKPRFVRETAIQNTDDASSSAREESTSSELSESGNTENQQEVSHDEAPRATAAASTKQQKASVNKGRKRKRGATDLGDHDEEREIIQLLKAQQEAITKSEEKDQKIMEAMLKFQEESKQCHQQLLVSATQSGCWQNSLQCITLQTKGNCNLMKMVNVKLGN